MDSFTRLRKSPAFRPIVVSASFLLLLGVTRFLPNQGTGPGTPIGVIVMGVIFGLFTALTATGIVLVYRTTRIVNFAQATLGGVGAIFAANMVQRLHWPFGLAFVFAVIIAAAFGIVAELILRRFFDAPRLVLTVGTVGVMGMASQFALGVPFLPIWGDNVGGAAETFSPIIKPLKSFGFTVAPFRFEFAHLLTLIVAPLALIAIALFLTRTRMGVAVRAAAENLERAEMLGINVRLLSTVVWALAGGLAGVAITLRGTATSFAISGITSVESLLPALAAAVLASMRSIPIAVAAAIGISVMDRAIYWSFPEQAGAYSSIVFFAIIVLGPLLIKKVRGRDREASSWEATQESRAIPRELTGVSEIRTWRNVAVGAGVAIVLLFPWISTTGPTNTAGLAAIVGIVILSLVVLTGWTGQVSLGQWGLVAVGALVGGAMTNKLHIPFWVAVPIGAMFTAGFGALLALPALRIRGLMLAVTTFAFAFVVNLVLFNERWFGWLIPQRVDRPTLLLLDFEDERSMYYLTIFFFAVCALMVSAIRRSRSGRILLALRENEDELTAVGINPVTTRIAAFMLSGFLAGVAGVVLAHHQRAVSQSTFPPEESLTVFLYAIIGGLGGPLGAVLGAAVRALQQLVPSDPILAFFLNPAFGVLAILYMAPRGFAGLVQSLRDSVLRVVAQRRGIVVPSLFADTDVEAIRSRQVLLAEPQEGRGISGLKRRYRLQSVVHSTRTGARVGGAPDERKALSSAAESLFERGLGSTERGAASGNGAVPVGGPPAQEE